MRLNGPGGSIARCVELVQHGSTIVAFAPEGVALCEHLAPGTVIRMGEPLLQLAPHP